MEILEKYLKVLPYEISLWDDVLTFGLDVEGYDEVIESEGRIPTEEDVGAPFTIIGSYYKEQLAAVIGSDTMTSFLRAHSPSFTTNINGTHTLEFTLYLKYYDEETQEYYSNPYCSLISNERKIKLHYKDLWYDFIVKKIDESSDKSQIVVTCEDQYINELSKNGFNLEFDTDLQNNMGTVEELAAAVLEESDWEIAEGDVIQQRIEEALYSVTTNRELIVHPMQDPSENITIPERSVVYVFADSVRSKASRTQLIYEEDYSSAIIDNVIQNSRDDVRDLYIDGVIYDDNFIPDFAANLTIYPSQYRGQRLVDSYETTYDPDSDKTVAVYEGPQGEELYAFEETRYISPTILQNYITCGDTFKTTSGWYSYNGSQAVIDVDPPYTETAEQDTITLGGETITLPVRKITLQFTGDEIRNSGLSDNPPSEGIIKGKEYLLHIVSNKSSSSLRVNIKKMNSKLETTATYLDNGTVINPGSDYDGTWIKYTATETATWAELRALNIAFYFSGIDTEEKFEKIEFFPYLTSTKILVQVDDQWKVQEVASPVVVTLDNQYTAAEIQSVTKFYIPGNLDDDGDVIIEAEYPTDSIPANYTPVKRENFVKVRSITEKESNRFNIIQSLCETFECWAKFTVLHNDDGSIKGAWDTETGLYKYEKYVSFHNYIGKDNDAGFKYGINLVSIQRKIESDQIVSKLIVKQNTNDYADGGFCTIARAESSPTGENFLYNFDYYIRVGLIDGDLVLNDLYWTGGDTQKWLGYYPKLRAINDENAPLIEEKSQIQSSVIPKLQALNQTYTIGTQSAYETYSDLKYRIEQYIGWDDLVKIAQKDESSLNANGFVLIESEYKEYYTSGMQCYARQSADSGNYFEDSNGAYFKLLFNGLSEAAVWSAVKDLYTQALTAINEGSRYSALQDDTQLSLDQYNSRVEEIEATLEANRLAKLELNKRFYQKYSRFIQEGSWTDDSYIDDEKYYLDALSILGTSTSPKISYTVSAVDVSQLQGYDLYTYEVGDKTYMEDPEFFGYIYVNHIKTPYQEEVILTEATEYLEQPEKNKFTVQNFKTRFEDLFQRITATTQSLQFSQGGYTRAAEAITSEGTIEESILQNSFVRNELTIQNSTDQSVTWDSSGITVTSLASPNQIIRLVSGGLFLSSDGGVSWTTGVGPLGINASALTAGQIDADRIRIMNGSFPAFGWDKKGISAYWYNDSGYNYNRFVRFDRYGVYGYRGDSQFDPETIDEVQDNASFALTWAGFKFRTDNGSVSIDSENDLQVLDASNQQRVKLGRLSDDNYGIEVKDSSGTTVLKTEEAGQLWLRDKLNIGATGNTVKIGVLGEISSDAGIPTDFLNSLSTTRQFINAANKFVVFEDGSVYANNGFFKGQVTAELGSTFSGELKAASGTFTGELKAATGTFAGSITASGGQIGNVTIEEINAAAANPNLMVSSPVTQFKVDSDGDATPNSSFQIEAKVIGSIATPTIKSYTWSYMNEGGDWVDANTSTATWTVSYSTFENLFVNNIIQIRCVAIAEVKGSDGAAQEVTISDSCTIARIYDGADAPEGVSVGLECSSNEIVRSKVLNSDGTISINYRDIVIRAFETVVTSTYDYKNYVFVDDSTDYSLKVQLKSYDGTIIATDTSVTLDFGTEENPAITFSLDKSEELKALISDDEAQYYFDFIFYYKNSIAAEQIFAIQTLVSDDVFRLNVNAHGLVGAIEDAGFNFDSNGLTIINGNLLIRNSQGTRLFEYDSDSEELSVTGNINATSGSFNQISIVKATIGSAADGIILESNGTNGNSIYSSNFEYGKTGFLISSDGSIKANNIELGNNATIANYLQLGENCFIYNPTDSNGHTFIEVKDKDDPNKSPILIQDGGYISIGDIELNGITSTLRGGSDCWYLTPEKAVFNNVTVRGSIEAATFEYGKIQTVGGIVTIRPSSVVNEINTYSSSDNTKQYAVFTLEQAVSDIWSDTNGYLGFTPAGQKGVVKYYYFDVGYGDKIAVLIRNNSTDTGNISILDELEPGMPVMLYPRDTTGSELAVSINLNSSGLDIVPQRAISLTYTDFSGDINSQLMAFNPVTSGELGTRVDSLAVLGYLPDSVAAKFPSLFSTTTGMNDKSRYGLYTQNAVLEGSIISLDGQHSSGISTKDIARIETEENGEKTSTPVVIWAGATLNNGVFDATSIANARFRVDALGNIYAEGGVFRGSVISDATISAAVLKTAKLIGTGTGPALSIEDTTNAIHFGDGEKTYFAVTSSAITVSAKMNVNATLDVNSDGGLNVTSGAITVGANPTFAMLGQTGLTIQNSSGSSELTLSGSTLKLGKYITSTTEFSSFSNNALFEKDVRFGSEKYEERQVTDSNGEVIGYDLYIL